MSPSFLGYDSIPKYIAAKWERVHICSTSNSPGFQDLYLYDNLFRVSALKCLTVVHEWRNTVVFQKVEMRENDKLLRCELVKAM